VKVVAKSQDALLINVVLILGHQVQETNLATLQLWSFVSVGRQAVTHAPSFLNSTVVMTYVTCERTELL
jgi:hypothetical protein